MGVKVISGLIPLFSLSFFLWQRQRQRKAVARSHGCDPATSYQPKEPFTGFDFQMKMYSDITLLHQLYLRYGDTYQVGSWISLPPVCTINPENVRAINLLKDFGITLIRLPGIEYFCRQGFITTDGETWSYSRKLLKPSFALSNVRDLTILKGEVDALLKQFLKDSQTFDFQPLLYVTVSLFKPTCLSPTHKLNVLRSFSTRLCTSSWVSTRLSSPLAHLLRLILLSSPSIVRSSIVCFRSS